MDQLREGIGLRAYGQKNPLIEYKQEGFSMFADMMSETNQETLKRIFRANIQHANHQPTAPKPMHKNLKMQHEESSNLGFIQPPKGMNQSSQNQVTAQRSNARQPITIEKKVGRNDSCPCGSGKKYKKCCG